jgi:cysteine desulfurase
VTIYLDHAATSPMLAEVVEAVQPWLGRPANPASVHAPGRAAAAAVEQARAEVAALLGRPPAGVVFCSGATEANHTAIRGLWATGTRRFAASPIEHPSVRGALEAVQASGAEILSLPVGRDGVVRLDLPSEVDALVLMAANHETGVRQPVGDAAALAARIGARLHVDATQALGSGPVDALALAETVALSAHKLGGPVGVGALSLRSGAPFPALLTGGSQERGRRAGTVDVAGVVGFGVACRLAREHGPARAERWGRLAASLRAGLDALGARPVGDRARAVPSTTTVVFEGVRGDALVQALDLAGIAVSSGAACASGAVGPSPVLAAMGEAEPAGGLRISFGPGTRADEVEALLAALEAALPLIREASSWE